jgi:hypothetical protein
MWGSGAESLRALANHGATDAARTLPAPVGSVPAALHLVGPLPLRPG